SYPPPLNPNPQNHSPLPRRRRPGAMVKAYLRYEPALSFGVVASPESNVVYD
uniref:Uncharacterized protein n=1 Tax=Aegilops tauschii subsp. strangulata TaxID=200361 RepID=A0A453J0H2_AEGTS